jgi:ankyrin repeat protein
MAQPSIDLRPYGLNWTLDPRKADAIPQSYEIASVVETPTKLTFRLDGWPAPQVIDISNRSGNAGSYGKTWSTTSVIDSVPLIVKYMDNSDGSISKSNFIKEAMMQIIVYNNTSTDALGPCCPRIFMVGKGPSAYYIVMEKLDITVKALLKREKYRPSVFANIMCQIAIVLSRLYSELQFNHRDFKDDNIMCKVTGTTYTVRLVDFGFSCLTYGNTYINTSHSETKHCNLQSRDLNALLYYFIYHGPGPSPIRSICSVLIDYYYERPPVWLNTYKYYNTAQENPNTQPQVVYNIFKNLKYTSDNWATPINPAWTSHLVAMTPKIYERLNQDEIMNLNPDVIRRYRETTAAVDLFFSAVTKKNRGLIEKIYSTDKDIFKRVNRTDQNIIHYVCALQDSLLLELIIDINEDPMYVNSVNSTLKTPLMFCIEGGWIAGFERLRQLPGLDITLCDRNEENVLHYAIKYQQIAMAETLIDHYRVPEFLNKISRSHETPLNMAIRANNLRCVSKLLSYNDINITGDPSVYEYCVFKNYMFELIKILHNNKAELGNQIRENPQVLQKALEQNKLEIMSIIIKNYIGIIDTNIVSRSGDTLLTVVDDIDLVNMLLTQNPDKTFINHVNNDGVSALKKAIQRNNVPIITRLLAEAAIDLDVPTASAPNLFFELAQSSCQYEPLFNRLAESQVRIDTVNNRGLTPLMIAAGKNNIWFVTMWLALPTRYTAVRDHEGNTALHYASYYSNTRNISLQTAIVTALLDANPALATIRNRHGRIWGQKPSSLKVARNTPIRAQILARATNKKRPLVNTNKWRNKTMRQTGKVRPL